MGIGAVFFLLGLFIILLNPHRNLGPGLLIAAASVAAIVGANYWRQHLHVVAQLTPQQLILRREGAVNWTDIAAIEIKEIHSRRATPTESRFACIRLKSRPAAKGRLDGFMQKVKHAVTGYDIIVPASELSCDADWFVAECHKRMAAAGAATPETQQDSRPARLSA
jgi:hypothetical protein